MIAHNTQGRFSMPYQGVHKWTMLVKAVQTAHFKAEGKLKTQNLILVLFNPVRPVGELKFYCFLLNFIQDKMLKNKTEEKRKIRDWGPQGKKAVFFCLTSQNVGWILCKCHGCPKINTAGVHEQS